MPSADSISLVLSCKFNRNSRTGSFFTCTVRPCHFTSDSVAVCFSLVWESRSWKREATSSLNTCNSQEIKWELRKLFAWLYKCIIIVKMLDWSLLVMDCEITREYLHLDEMSVDPLRLSFWVASVHQWQTGLQYCKHSTLSWAWFPQLVEDTAAEYLLRKHFPTSHR